MYEFIEAKEMLAYKHSGFSVDTSVRIEADDRSGLERLLRYYARAVCHGEATQGRQRFGVPLRLATQRAGRRLAR
jgi:Putative transposase